MLLQSVILFQQQSMGNCQCSKKQVLRQEESRKKEDSSDRVRSDTPKKSTDTFDRVTKQSSQRSYSLDSEIEAKFSSIRVVSPSLQCDSSKRSITKICLNPKCINSLRCPDLGCLSCGKSVHPLCNSVTLEEVTSTLNERVDIFKEFMVEVFRVEEEIIVQRVRRSQKQLLDRFILNILENNDIEELKQFSLWRNLKTFTGQSAFDLCKKLQFQWSTSLMEARSLLDKYSQCIAKATIDLTLMKNQIFKSFLTQLPSQGPSPTTNLQNIDTKIIRVGSQEGQEQLAFLDKNLVQPSKMELLFRASEHNFRAQEFHNKCDGIKDTLVIVRTACGSTFAGYSHYKWNEVKNGSYVKDPARKAFLLQLNRKQKIVPQQDGSLIGCHKDWGPVFGEGDLYLSDKCNTNSNSGAFLPKTYNKHYKRFKCSQESWNAFSGATSGYHFRVEEYEVYSLEWAQGSGLYSTLIFYIAQALT